MASALGTSSVARAWRLLPHDRTAIERLAAAADVPAILAQQLLQRGVRDAPAARRFLQAPLADLRPPQQLPGIVEATELLAGAVRAGRRIVIYGDYDVDGLTGTAILLQTLRLMGAQVDFYVPHRLHEGYGLNVDALAQLARDGASVVVTVDCGIGSLAEAVEAHRLGLELIITDHHPCHEHLPAAAAIVHPRRPDSSYPFDGLSGSGVAFKLAWALCQHASGGEKVTERFRDHLVESVLLAALGMIADVVPLLDENRVFVRHGMGRLHKSSLVGLGALLQVANLHERKQLRASDVAYFLAPRINAAGRLGCARLVVELLTCPSVQRATELARYLDDQNAKRQRLERAILADACRTIEADSMAQAPALILASPEWHAGVIGIVAGRLAERYGRPALMIAVSKDGAVGHGSGRSIPGFALHEALRACAEDLLSHGGHAAAAGFKLPYHRVDAFRERFCDYAARHFPNGPPAPTLTMDAELPLSALTVGLLDALNRLEPYGAGNPRPIFMAGPVQVSGEPRKVGKGERHVQFRVRQDTTTHQAIAFNMADRIEELLSADGACCIAFTPSINEWQGRRSVQLEIRDFQAGTQARLS